MSEREPEKLSPIAVIAMVVGLAIPVAAIALSYRACVGTTTRGAVSVRGPGLTWRGSLGTCTADPGVLTVGLGDEGAPPSVLAVLDPLDGPRLELVAPALPAAIVLTPATCPGLRVEVRRAGTRGDGSPLLDGSASASCRTASGVQIDLDAWWRACHVEDPP